MSIISNIKWVAIAELFKIAIQIANLLVITQFVAPNEYGLMAIAMVVVNFGMLLKDQGISKAVIQKKTLSEELKNAAFWFGLYLSLVIMLITAFSSFKISEFYSEEKLVSVLLLISLIFPLNAISSIHTAILERNSDFKLLSYIETISNIISFAIAILLAIYGYGVYSLVFQALTYSFLNSSLVIAKSKWNFSLKSAFKLKPIRELFKFSANLFFFNLVNYASRNSDNILIGKFMSVSALGAYNLAYRIMQFPLKSITFVVARSLLPVLSKNQDDNQKIINTYSNCVFSILFLVLPGMLFLNLFAPTLIQLLLGDEWSLAGEVLSWLSICAIIQSVLSLSGSVFMSKGKTDQLLKLGLVGGTLHITGFLIGVNYDIITFSKIYLFTNTINAVVVLTFTAKLIGSNPIHIMRYCFNLFIVNFLVWAIYKILLNLDILENLEINIFSITLLGTLYFITSFLLLLIFDKKIRDTSKKTYKKIQKKHLIKN